MMRNLTNKSSFNEDIPRERVSFFHNFFAVAISINFLRRYQHLRNVRRVKATISKLCIEILFHLSFFTTHGTQNVPSFLNLRHSNLPPRLMWINDIFHNILKTKVNAKDD